VISVVAEEELTVDNIEDVIEKYKEFGPENALWIVVTGIWSIVTCQDEEKMNKRYLPTINTLVFNWKSPSAVENAIKQEESEINNQEIKNEHASEEKMGIDVKDGGENKVDESQDEESANKMAEMREEYIKKLVSEAYDIKFKILTILGDNCAVVMAPPIIPAILPGKNASSKKNKGNLRALGTGFNKFSKAWITMAMDMFEDQKLFTGVLNKYNEEKQQFPYYVNEPDAELRIKDHASETWFNMVRSLMKLEPRPDKMAVKFEDVVVIGVPEAAERFHNVHIRGMTFNDVGIRFTKVDNDVKAFQLLAEHLISSPRTLWVLLCDMSNWFSSMSFCQRYFLDLTRSMCKDSIKMHIFKGSAMPVDYEKALEFVKKVKPYLGEHSAIFLSPVIPQTILLPPVDKEGQGTFHKTLHQKCPASVRNLIVYPPDVDRDEFAGQLLTFENEWLKVVEQVLRSQNLRVDFLEKYVSSKEGNSIAILEDTKDYKGLTKSYFDWEGFMEEFIK
ncbi:unnamed protein product, partial [Meganyctiphanes norvegica]